MPRRARLILPNVPLHIIHRGNNKQQCFFCESDYRVYLEWLSEYASENGCQIHAYVLMSNHVHLLVSINLPEAPSRMMKGLAQRYTQYINRRYLRTGTLWEGRYRSCLVQDELYFLICQRYIELNPVRAGMVSGPNEYPWSSYGFNALGSISPLLHAHSIYLALGSDAGERQSAYCALFKDIITESLLSAVRKATNGNFALGNESFIQAVSSALGRRAMPGHAGRPKNLLRGQTTITKKYIAP